MKNVIKLFLIVVLFFSFFSFFNSISAVNAQELDSTLGVQFAQNLDLPNSGETDIRNMAVVIIKYLISFLGLIAVIIILYGGFTWMTAAGNEDRITKAKGIIVAGVIGLIVIIAAFAIVQFVISMAGDAISGNIG